MRKFVGVQITRNTCAYTSNTHAVQIRSGLATSVDQDHILALRVTSTASTVVETGRKSGQGKPCLLAYWLVRFVFTP